MLLSVLWSFLISFNSYSVLFMCCVYYMLLLVTDTRWIVWKCISLCTWERSVVHVINRNVPTFTRTHTTAAHNHRTTYTSSSINAYIKFYFISFMNRLCTFSAWIYLVPALTRSDPANCHVWSWIYLNWINNFDWMLFAVWQFDRLKVTVGLNVYDLEYSLHFFEWNAIRSVQNSSVWREKHQCLETTFHHSCAVIQSKLLPMSRSVRSHNLHRLSASNSRVEIHSWRNCPIRYNCGKWNCALLRIHNERCLCIHRYSNRSHK